MKASKDNTHKILFSTKLWPILILSEAHRREINKVMCFERLPVPSAVFQVQGALKNLMKAQNGS